MVENHPDIRKQEYRGIACLVLSAFCFALMSMFVHLAGDLPSMQKSFFRNLVAALAADDPPHKSYTALPSCRKLTASENTADFPCGYETALPPAKAKNMWIYGFHEREQQPCGM